jgi:hypothetical protein
MIFFFEVLDCAGLCWPSLAFLAFVALDYFLKLKLAFADKKSSTIGLFPIITCQNQFLKVIGHSKFL